jgi:curved DNA-binding protein
MNGNRKTIHFSIPPGTADGARIKLKGQGGPGMNGGAAGDLYLRVRIRDPRFELDGLNLTADARLLPWEAALGAQIPFDTPDGQILVKVPAGMQTDQRVRIAGRGYRNRKGERGDLYVRVKIVNPSALTAEQRRLYEQLQNTGGAPSGR